MDIERISRLSAISRLHHEGQFDLAGNPYFEHVERVAGRLMLLGVERLVVVAYFHDFSEDVKGADVIIESLDLNSCELELISGMTVIPSKRSSYDRFYLGVYIKAMAANASLALVKICDLLDNSDPERFFEETEKSIRRICKYAVALEFLVKSLEGSIYSLNELYKKAPLLADEIVSRLEYMKWFVSTYVKPDDSYLKLKKEFEM